MRNDDMKKGVALLGAGVVGAAIATALLSKRAPPPPLAPPLLVDATAPRKMDGEALQRVPSSPAVQPSGVNVWKVVITGGPCAGKTTGLNSIISELEQRGMKVWTVPEAATLFIQGGLSWGDTTVEQRIAYQTLLLQTQQQLEKAFTDAALAYGGKSLVMCDRGSMDGKAYCAAEEWQAVLDKVGKTETELCELAYDGVFHLVTAADGAEEFYTLRNNTARSETPEQARDADMRLRDVYLGHPYLRVIGNGQDGFDGKMERLVQSIGELVGTAKTPCHRRYLVEEFKGEFPVAAKQTEVSILFLMGSEEGDIKRLFKFGVRSYYQRQRTICGVRVTTEQKLTNREYRSYLLQVDSKREAVRKLNTSFFWKGEAFQLGVVQSPAHAAGTSILYSTLAAANSEAELPTFLKVLKEVTNDSQYTSWAIGGDA